MDVPAEVFMSANSHHLEARCGPFFRGTYNIGLRQNDAALKMKWTRPSTNHSRRFLERILRKWVSGTKLN